MLRNLRERLTYKSLLRLLGVIFALYVGVLWLLGQPVFGLPQGHEPLLFILTILGTLALSVLASLFPGLDKPVSRRREDIPISETQRAQNRKDMLALVEKIWISGFLDHVLNEMDALKLPMAFAEPGKVLEKPGMKDYHLPNSTAILQTFRDLGRRLVILGEPGSGKTVTLLQLARELIGEARTDDKRPVPVVLALSSWAAERLPFEDWLRQEIRERYDVPSKITDDLVLGEQLVYLLDGLDEVAEEHRHTCVEFIKAFVDARKVDFVLCCRRREYEALSVHPDILAQVVIQPLTETQIDDYLSDHAFAGLRALRRDSLIVQDFSRIPFMLNTMAVVTRGQPETALRLTLEQTDDPAHLRDYFLEEYLSQRLREGTHKKYSDVGQIRSRLKWLAQQLIAHDETDLYIENLQFDWLGESGIVQLRRLLLLRALVLVIALIAYLAKLASDANPIEKTIESYGFTTLSLLLGAISPGSIIVPIAKVKWKIDIRFILFGLISTALLYLFTMLIAHESKADIQFPLLVLLTTLAGSISASNSIEPFSTMRPNSGIVRSFLNFSATIFVFPIFVAVVIAIPVATIGTLWGLSFLSPILGITVGMLFGLVLAFLRLLSGLENGGAAAINHMVLRFALAREGYVPLWRYDKFLDYCAELVILRKVGGGYRFVHDYLRQYLASAAFVPEEATRGSEED